MERLQKILARGGVASRRAAEALIAAGRVRVNGRVVSELGLKADPRRDRVEVDGKRVVAEAPVYAALHKPRGVVSTMHDPEGRPTVRELLAPIGARVYPVGRLDFATSGILLATNDGAFADGLLHPRREVPKTYVVKVKGVMSPDVLDRWRKGVRLEDGMTLAAQAKLLRVEDGKTWFELTIREGKNQQIRRMGEATGFPVMRLARTTFAGISIEGIRPGAFRFLTRDELVALKKAYGVPRSVSAPPPVPQPGRRSPPARGGAARDTGAGRYGGGAPARRAPDTREDWGGGVRRGSSGGRDDRKRDGGRGREGFGARGGRTRTTGTAGGIGAHEDADRIKGRRGR